jgi:molybdenum cofactor guanylyltransferase
MKILGAILAGGKSQRFGSDKAEALFEGKPLLEQVANALYPQVDSLVVVGRKWQSFATLPDYPKPGLEPLGGLAAALVYAEEAGFDAVLSSGCDLLGIPIDLLEKLGPGPAIIDDQPLLGLWPATAAAFLTSWLNEEHNRSVYRFADHIGARRVPLSVSICNANRPQDLA